MNALITALQYKWLTNVFPLIAADNFGTENGSKTRSYGQSIVGALMNIALGVGGGVLAVVGVKDIVSALMGENKDWKKAGIGIVCLVAGGGFLIMTVANVYSWANTLGNDFSNLNK